MCSQYSARMERLWSRVERAAFALVPLIGRNALYMVLAACLPAWGAKPCALACVGLDVGLWKVLQLAGKLSANGSGVYDGN